MISIMDITMNGNYLRYVFSKDLRIDLWVFGVTYELGVRFFCALETRHARSHKRIIVACFVIHRFFACLFVSYCFRGQTYRDMKNDVQSTICIIY